MITIITEPSLDKVYHLKKMMKNFIKKHFLKKEIPKYSGHYAVVRSLLTGLDKIGFTYNYNPTNLSNCYDHVHVLAGVNTLRLAIKLKTEGKIKRLTAGPNIVISASDYSEIITHKEIDKVIVPSDWVRKFYQLTQPSLKKRVDLWPAGVDINYWDIKKKSTLENKIIFYNKRPEHNIYNNCKKLAVAKGYNVIEINCGSYTLEEFRTALTSSSFVVYFVEQESQGIALSEIWASNTPTLVWNPEIWMYKNINYSCNSAPYLTEKTGIFFRTIIEFEKAINEFEQSLFTPREWVLKNMTDEICANNFISSVKTNNNE